MSKLYENASVCKKIYFKKPYGRLDCLEDLKENSKILVNEVRSQLVQHKKVYKY